MKKIICLFMKRVKDNNLPCSARKLSTVYTYVLALLF